MSQTATMIFNSTQINNHSHFELSEIDDQAPPLKTTFSIATMDSPLTPSRKCPLTETDCEEDESCSAFQERCYCREGQSCSQEHVHMKIKPTRSFMLRNYPELLMMGPGLRSHSFLQ